MRSKPLLLVTLFALVAGLAASGTRASPEPTLILSPGPIQPPMATPALAASAVGTEVRYTLSFEETSGPFQVPSGQVECRTVLVIRS